MGADTSKIPLADIKSKQYMFIVNNGRDTLFVGYGGDAEHEIVRNAISKYWMKGLQKEEPKFVHRENGTSNIYKFTLNGVPFSRLGCQENMIPCARLCAKILSDMYNLGWKVVVSTDLSRRLDKTTWIFQRHNQPPDAGHFMTIGLVTFDSLQITDCPEPLKDVIKSVVTTVWTNGIQKEHSDTASNTYTLKLKGYPWSNAEKRESCQARRLIKELIQTLSGYQWLLYANSNINVDADTMFFRHVPTSPVAGPLDYTMISLNCSDCLRFMDISDDILHTLEKDVNDYWYKPVQDVIDTRPECYEMKLKGNPWCSYGEESNAARYLLVKLMERMASYGYFILTGLDITRKSNGKSLFLFQRGAPLNARFFCLSLNRYSEMRLINAPENILQEKGTSQDVNVKNQPFHEIVSGWLLGLEETNTTYPNVSYQFPTTRLPVEISHNSYVKVQVKLKGLPWINTFRGDGVHARGLLLRLLEYFNSCGWRLMCSADISSKFNSKKDVQDDVHSWFFMYDESLLSSQ